MKKITLIATLLMFGTYAKAQYLDFSIQTPTAVCHPGDCTILHAQHPEIHNTQDYSVSSIPFAPPFPFTGGTSVNFSLDDAWVQLITLPFNFSFYGTSRTQFLIGTNGIITFDTSYPIFTSNACTWNYSTTIPNAGFPIKDAIYSVYQDLGQGNMNSINYQLLDTGQNASPNRIFIVNFDSLPLWSYPASICGVVGLQTTQVVLHEATNVIEIFVKRREACTNWNQGRGLLGIQNATGTSAVTPPDRNTGAWSAQNEAWRFTPAGTEIVPTISWTSNATPIGIGEQITVCPTTTTTYTGTMSYTDEGGNATQLFDSITIEPLQDLTNNPQDITVCNNTSGFYTANIDQEASILGSLNPVDYEVRYYESATDAANVTPNYITTISNYSFTANHTIYASVEDLLEGCITVKPFDLIIAAPVAPPTGVSVQTFSSGQTLADLVVNGQNITWYDTPDGGNILPPTTLLVEGTTYYASQSINGCESRITNSTRFAVTVYNILGNKGFDKNTLQVYPNPVDNVLTVSFVENIKSITVYNAVGQKIMVKNPAQKETKLDLSDVNAGVYFIKVEAAGNRQTIRIVKN